MKQRSLHMLTTAFAVSSLLFFVVAPAALAHGGPIKEDDMATTTTSGSSSSSDTQNQTDDFGSPDNVNQTEVQNRIKDFRAQAKLNLADRRQGHEAKTAERRQQICENRKTSINNKITAFSKSGENILTRFNDVYARVKNFKTDKKLDVANYDELIATADAKGQAATESVAALKDLSGQFDCTSTDPAQTVAAIKTATAETKAALKEYRTAIKNIVVALAQVHKTSDGTSTDQSSTTDSGTPADTTTNNTEAQ